MKKKIRNMFIILLCLNITFCGFAMNASASNNNYAMGCIPDRESELNLLKITEENYSDLPKTTATEETIDLSSKFPRPGYQGSQGSCTAWAVAYALKSYQENLDYSWGVSSASTQFSPAYVYNQINDGVDEGSSILDAMRLIQQGGVCTLADMPYNQSNFTTQPTQAQKTKAANYKSLSYATLDTSTDIKNWIKYKGSGVVISIPVFPDFDNLNAGNSIYDNTNGTDRGLHAVCIVGYDDSKQAFKIINSWGTNWGIGGYGYISYNLFDTNNDCWGFVMTDDVTNVGDWIEQTVSGDFNGDGKTDILRMVDMKTWRMQLQVQSSNSSSFNNFSVWYDYYGFNTDKVADRITAGDFNGDGKDDIAVMYKYDPIVENRNRMKIHIFLSTGSSFSYGGVWGYDDWYTADRVYAFESGDFNGDGKDDIANLYQHNVSHLRYLVFSSTGIGFNKWNTWYNNRRCCIQGSKQHADCKHPRLCRRNLLRTVQR